MEHIHLWQVVVLLALGGYVYYSRRQKGGAGGGRPAAKAEQTPEEVYLDLRRQALETDAKKRGLAADLKPEDPFGVVMEMGISSSVVTLACFADGDASVYYKSGGGIIGGLSHSNVRKAAKELVALSQPAVPRMTPTTTFPLPGEDRVRFYVLTRRAVLTVETNRQTLGERQNELAALFQSGQEVVAQMRQVGQD
jgi:hypothetical protein